MDMFVCVCVYTYVCCFIFDAYIILYEKCVNLFISVWGLKVSN